MNLGELYADESRATSAELDFGVHWREAPEPVGRRWRLAYLFATGELYALALDRSSVVEILGVFQVEACRSCSGAGSGCDRCVSTGWSRDRVEQVLEGWEEHCEAPYGLRWVRRRLHGWQVEAAA